MQSGVHAQGTPPQPHTNEPPPGFVPSTPVFAKLKYAQAGIEGRASYSVSGKNVTIAWRHVSPDADALQTFATGYWPTSIVALASGNELAVSGKRRNGNTVIEIWKIQKPLLVAPLPPGSGQAHFQNALIESIETVYDESTHGRDMALRMFSKPGEQKALLVQFWDSRDFYNLDYSANDVVLTAVASASNLPALSANFTFSWSRDHKTRGYIYVFSDEDTPNSTLVFIDQNRDKVIDSVMMVSTIEWNSGNWGGAENYNF